MADKSGSLPGSRPKRGMTIFLTGLPSAGKSTIAEALRDRLLGQTGRPVCPSSRSRSAPAIVDFPALGSPVRKMVIPRFGRLPGREPLLSAMEIVYRGWHRAVRIVLALSLLWSTLLDST